MQKEREKRRGEEEKVGGAELLSAATGPLTGISNSAAECRLGTKLTLLVFCCGFLERVATPREGRVRRGQEGWGLTLEFSLGFCSNCNVRSST